jgi:integrase
MRVARQVSDETLAHLARALWTPELRDLKARSSRHCLGRTRHTKKNMKTCIGATFSLQSAAIRGGFAPLNNISMIQRRRAGAEIETKIGNHTFRATGITAYLKNGSTLKKAAAMANHSSTRTTQFYDRHQT